MGLCQARIVPGGLPFCRPPWPLRPSVRSQAPTPTSWSPCQSFEEHSRHEEAPLVHGLGPEQPGGFETSTPVIHTSSALLKADLPCTPSRRGPLSSELPSSSQLALLTCPALGLLRRARLPVPGQHAHPDPLAAVPAELGAVAAVVLVDLQLAEAHRHPAELTLHGALPAFRGLREAGRTARSLACSDCSPVGDMSLFPSGIEANQKADGKGRSGDPLQGI